MKEDNFNWDFELFDYEVGFYREESTGKLQILKMYVDSLKYATTLADVKKCQAFLKAVEALLSE